VDARILEIVFYLMDYVQDSDDQLTYLSEYSSDLKSLGYSSEEISTAYNWILDHLGTTGESLFSAFPRQVGSYRILTDVERARLTPAAYGFLLKLSNLGLINSEQFETVLDRLTLVGAHMVTPEQIKLIASAIVLNEFGDADRSLIQDPDADVSSRVN